MLTPPVRIATSLMTSSPTSLQLYAATVLHSDFPGLCGSVVAGVLEQLGPVVVNSDGTLARITNWQVMTDGEKETCKRLIAKRNGTSAATQSMLKRARRFSHGAAKALSGAAAW